MAERMSPKIGARKLKTFTIATWLYGNTMVHSPKAIDESSAVETNVKPVRTIESIVCKIFSS